MSVLLSRPDRRAGLRPAPSVLLLSGLLLISQSLVTRAADDDAASAAVPSPSPVACLANDTAATSSPSTGGTGDDAVAPLGGVTDDTSPDTGAACQVSVPLAFLDDTSPASSPPSPIIIEAHEFAFGPGSVTISSAGPTTIELQDTGVVPHNLTVDALDILIVAAAGRSAAATVQDLAPGTYEFYCSISGHRQAGMVGTLIVQ